MEGNVALPLTGMNGMWKIVTINSGYVDIPNIDSGSPNKNQTIACPDVNGYTPVGIVGWSIMNGSSGSGETNTMPFAMAFDPGAKLVQFKVRNVSNMSSSTQSVNSKGGQSIKIQIVFRVLYLRESEDGSNLPSPSDPVTVTDVMTMTSGVNYHIVRYGRIAVLYANGVVNAAFSQWAVIGSGFPKPIVPVLISNAGDNGKLLNLTQDGVLQVGYAVAKNGYIQFTIPYITASE